MQYAFLIHGAVYFRLVVVDIDGAVLTNAPFGTAGKAREYARHTYGLTPIETE